MPGLAIVLLLASATLLLTAFDLGTDADSQPSDPSEEDTTPEDDAPEEPQTIVVSPDMSFTGSDEDDTFTIAESEDFPENITLASADGDDLIDFSNGPFDVQSPSLPRISSSTLDLGAGEDTIRGSFETSEISLGADADTANVYLLGGEIDGGSGNDTITAQLGPSDVATARGGDGDDTIISLNAPDEDANPLLPSFAGNLNIFGDAGNDRIETSGAREAGAGYEALVDGGTGDDTLSHAVTPFVAGEIAAPFLLDGGEGADVYALTLSEGVSFEVGNTPALQDGAIRLSTVDIELEPGIDLVVIELASTLDGYTAETARLETRTVTSGAGETTVNELIIRFESSQGDPARDVVVSLGERTPSFDDFAFVGDNASTLTLAT